MPSNFDASAKRFVSDMVSIGRWARDEDDRRRALKKSLDGPWATDEVGRVYRVENSRRWGWEMNPYVEGDTGPPAE